MMEIINKRANFNYDIEDTIECGLVLTGTEIKSLRQGMADIKEAFAVIKNKEIFLINMFIKKYDQGNIFNHDERRTRKLLLHSKEIKKLAKKIEQDGYGLVPIKIYLKKGYAKVLLGVGKGKKTYDKRQTIKERDLAKEEQRI